ncbi:hypothetical protein [Massilia sp. erpn]|uniref:hypothetical protein n=1 Tax=Massilia sp. erpn TaxID=2738142 RepID=UPI00210462F7|nr:hypothetical protein [Massilia sp. erpn]
MNERIQKSDISKYNIEEINKKFVVGGSNSDQWTIDRDRNIYLRCVARGREEFRNQSTWTLHCMGDLISLDLELLAGEGEGGEPGWSHWKLRHLSIPSHLNDNRSEILAILRDALTAYKDGGIYSINTTYSVTLDN